MNDTIETFNKLFKIAPVRCVAVGGEIVTVCHRVGPAGGSYSVSRLAEILGLGRKLGRHLRSLQVRYAVREYRKHLTVFYKTERLQPLFAFVQTPQGEELYLQGFVDPKSSALKVGYMHDALLWCETMLLKTKPGTDNFGTAMGLSGT